MGGMAESAFDLALSPYEAGMDSLGISRHGRDMVHQEAMAREQMKWQSEENQKNRDFSMEMYNLQRDNYLKDYPELQKMQSDAQFNLWKNQFSEQNAYNSPQAQVARSLVAGQNPSGQSGMVQASNNNMSASQMSPPPMIQGSPLGGSASPVGIPQGMSEGLMRDLGGFIKDMSQADVNKETIEKLAAEVDKFLAEKDLIDSQRNFQEMKNGVYQVLGYTRETKEIIKLVKEAYQAEATGDYMHANKKFAEANEELVRSEKKLNDEKLPWVSKIFKSEMELNQARTREANAKAFEASETAKIQVSIGAYYQAMADTENALRDGRTTAQELANDISVISKYIAANELKYSDNTLEARCKMVVEGLKQQQLITQQQYEVLQQNIVASKWAERNQFRDYCLSFLNGTANVLGAASGFYNGSINRMNQEDKNRIQQDFNDIIREKYAPNDVKHVSGFGYTPEWQK